MLPTHGSSYLLVGYPQPLDGVRQYGAAVWLTESPACRSRQDEL